MKAIFMPRRGAARNGTVVDRGARTGTSSLRPTGGRPSEVYRLLEDWSYRSRKSLTRTLRFWLLRRLSALASICRMRSRVTPNSRPTSSSV
jgi:hypothetical protein